MKILSLIAATLLIATPASSQVSDDAYMVERITIDQYLEDLGQPLPEETVLVCPSRDKADALIRRLSAGRNFGRNTAALKAVFDNSGCTGRLSRVRFVETSLMGGYGSYDPVARETVVNTVMSVRVTSRGSQSTWAVYETIF